jgi:hypothetical protein
MSDRPEGSLIRLLAVAVGTLALILTCIGYCMVSTPVVGSSTFSRMPGVLTIHACVGVTTIPSLRAGIAWYSPLSSYRGPLSTSPYAVCADIPWPRMPRSLHREWMLPPVSQQSVLLLPSVPALEEGML